MGMTREEFEQTNWKMTYDEYLKCYCPNCKEENCVHREAFRRVPQIDGGLGLCPNLIERKESIKKIIIEKCDERERDGYDTLADSDVMSILDNLEKKGIEISRTELEKIGL